METQLEKTASTINADIPCSECRYNLRGLDSEGRCPECGLPIGTSCTRWEQRQGRALSSADRSWTRELLEGAILLWLAMAIQLSACLIDVHRPWRGPNDGVAVLVLLCTAWVLACHGADKLTKEPKGIHSTPEEERWRKWLRYSAVAYAVMPLLWGITNGGWALGDGLPLWYMLTGALAVTTSMALFQHLSALAKRAEAGWLSASLQLLSVAYVPYMTIWAIETTSENMRGGDNSYNLMITLPLPVQGPAIFSRELVQAAFSWWWQVASSPMLLMLTVIWVITPAFLFWFIWAIRRHLREARKIAK